MTVVVSDTSPINYLVLIGQIDVLQKLFGNVVIPQAVHHELQNPATPDTVRHWISPLPHWLQVKSPISTFVASGLGAGESQAIALAKEIAADLLIIDERRGSKAAQASGLRTAGTLAILEIADIQGLLDFETAVSQLQSTTFHEPAEIIQAMTESARRRKTL